MSSSSYARIIHFATSVLCSTRGSMSLVQLHRRVFQRFDITEDEFFCYIVKKCPRFLVLRAREEEEEEEEEEGWGRTTGTTGTGTGGGTTIVAKTSLRLCRSYSKQDCTDCQNLHLCKYFVYGNCRYGKGRKPCKFSHDVRSDHNYPLLRECTLHELSEDDLFLLLLQNDPSMLPEVCSHYNKGTGPYGACTFRDNCAKVHLCMHYVQGDCLFGHKCKRQHIIDQLGRRMLEERGLSGDVIHDLPFIYQNIYHLNASETTPDPLLSRISSQSDERNEICLHFIRKNCRFQDKCVRVHFHLPYKWEISEGDGGWRELKSMEEIERNYCDPRRTHSPGARPVDFLAMTRESVPVRRLSTASSITKPAHYILTTEWLWFYKGDHENWVEYGRPDDKQRLMSATSRDLEEAYLADNTAEITVTKGHRQYYLSYQDMYQRNLKHNTKRKVRRRPKFVSAREVEKLTTTQ